METVIKEKEQKANSFLKWVYTIKLNGNILFKDAFIRYSKRIGSNFIVVDEFESHFQDLYDEKPKPLFKSSGKIVGFYKNPITDTIVIFTNKGESFEISKDTNDLFDEDDED